ncbi:MAG: ATP-binding protein [Capsulimonas sp.]|uniref:ATP-binding protein n=1 Tax=Capsulimonas sp. TaxID=2494211 RepID=UPI0032630E4B
MCLKPTGARAALLSRALRFLRPILHPLICQQEFAFCRDVLSGVTDGKLSLHLNEDTLPLMLADRSPVIYLPSGPDGLKLTSSAKDELRAFARAEALPDELREKLITACWEGVTNAVKYGFGGSLRICASATRIQVWITDRGPGISLSQIPSATLRDGYSTGGTAGLGYTLMINSAHHLDLMTSPRGTTVVLTWPRESAEDPRITQMMERYS